MKLTRRTDSRSRILFFVELALWLFVIVAAVYASLAGLSGGGMKGSERDYLVFYAALSVTLTPVLAGVLILPFRSRSRNVAVGLWTVALPAFLLAVLLHIAAWGVAASRWLTNLQPRFGSVLWTFVLPAVPLALALTLTYTLKLSLTVNEDTPATRESSRPRSTARWRGAWFAALSALFIALVSITAAGAASTAADVRGNWFPGEMTTWTHAIVAVSMSILLAVLIASAWMNSRRGSRADGNDTARSHPASRSGRLPWMTMIGPVFVGAIFLLTSIVSLLTLGMMNADPRLNTGVVLFVSYGSSLFPSYVIVCVLRILYMCAPGGIAEETSYAHAQ